MDNGVECIRYFTTIIIIKRKQHLRRHRRPLYRPINCRMCLLHKCRERYWRCRCICHSWSVKDMANKLSREKSSDTVNWRCYGNKEVKVSLNISMTFHLPDSFHTPRFFFFDTVSKTYFLLLILFFLLLLIAWMYLRSTLRTASAVSGNPSPFSALQTYVPPSCRPTVCKTSCSPGGNTLFLSPSLFHVMCGERLACGG